MLTEDQVSLRASKETPWYDLGGDGQKHQVHDAAKIPSYLLTNDQVKALQNETLRLRVKLANRKRALRDSNLALERYQRLSLRRLDDRNNLQDGYDRLFERFTQQRERKCECK